MVEEEEEGVLRRRQPWLRPFDPASTHMRCKKQRQCRGAASRGENPAGGQEGLKRYVLRGHFGGTLAI